MNFHRTLCICRDGLSPHCRDGQMVEIDFPLGADEWPCPYCGGRLRQASESEIEEARRMERERQEARSVLREHPPARLLREDESGPHSVQEMEGGEE